MNEVKNINQVFNHLKIHTQYSICEGALRTADLAKYCKNNNVRAVGLCDTNNLCGALEFSETLSKSKTQPIIGSQINIQYKNYNGKIPFFAKNLQGYKNLIKLSSKSYLDIKVGDEPHCKFDDILNNHEGLIILTGTIDGFFGKLFSKNLAEEAFILIQKLKKNYKDNLYLEVQRHEDQGEKMFEKYLKSSMINP